jgi:hypothetical protein
MKSDYESGIWQRRVLGFLCAFLAPLSLIFGFFGASTNYPGWYLSISDTYYANDKMIMIGLLCATSIFFFTYKGYDWRDRVMSIFQAIGALGVVAFPCKSAYVATTGIFNLKPSLSEIFHVTSATILFVAFAVNILWLFTKTGENPTKEKIKRNRIYKICGWIILITILVQIIEIVSGLVVKVFIPKGIPYVLINEFIMLMAFAFAWFVKGELFNKLNDK